VCVCGSGRVFVCTSFVLGFVHNTHAHIHTCTLNMNAYTHIGRVLVAWASCVRSLVTRSSRSLSVCLSVCLCVSLCVCVSLSVCVCVRQWPGLSVCARDRFVVCALVADLSWGRSWPGRRVCACGQVFVCVCVCVCVATCMVVMVVAGWVTHRLFAVYGRAPKPKICPPEPQAQNVCLFVCLLFVVCCLLFVCAFAV